MTFDIFDQLMSVLQEVNSELKSVESKLEGLLEVLEKPKTTVTVVVEAETDEVEIPLHEILVSAVCSGNKIILHTPKLKRSSYLEADKLLRCLGGKWVGGKTKAHVFESGINPELRLKAFIERGELPNLNPLAFFATRPKTAKLIINHISPANSKRVLDADAGEGALSIALKTRFPNAIIDMVEIDTSRVEKLRQLELGTVIKENFLEFNKGEYTAVVMNPPFNVKDDTKAYITHIQHAWKLLQCEGQLIAIAPLGFIFSSETRCVEFKRFVEQFGSYEELPPKSFEGTDVSAVVISLKKPKVFSPTPEQQQLSLFAV